MSHPSDALHPTEPPRRAGGVPFSAAALLALAACAATPPEMNAVGEAAADDTRRLAIEVVLDDFHAAAAEADGERYFGHFTEDAVFLGTDATERWSLAEFRDYAKPRFDEGGGWTYAARERHVFLGPDGRSAWFDERLWNEGYGECRGTGALRETDGRWRIAHYSLTFPIPNDLAREFTQRIRELDGQAR